MATDEQLIQQTKEGKRDAYGQLFGKYYQQVYSICLSILQNPHDAQEATQEAFIQGYLKLNQLRKPDKFFVWLKKIAQNHSKECLRKKGHEIISLADTQTAREEDIGIVPDEHVLMKELKDAITEAIELLPKKEREAIQARMDGLNHAETSKQFGISYQASRARLYRARKKITEHVKDLLDAVIGLPKILSSPKIILGGMQAVKIGVTTKLVTVWTATLLAFAGIAVFVWQTKTSKPMMSESKEQSITTSAIAGDAGAKSIRGGNLKESEVSFRRKPSVAPDTDGVADEKMDDWFEQSQSDEIEPTLDISPEITEENNPEEDEEAKMRQMEAEILVVEQELRTILTRAVEIHRLLTSTPLPLEVKLHGKEMDAEKRRLRQEAFLKAGRYGALMKAVGRKPVDLYPGGWVYDAFEELWARFEFKTDE